MAVANSPTGIDRRRFAGIALVATATSICRPTGGQRDNIATPRSLAA